MAPDQDDVCKELNWRATPVTRPPRLRWRWRPARLSTQPHFAGCGDICRLLVPVLLVARVLFHVWFHCRYVGSTHDATGDVTDGGIYLKAILIFYSQACPNLTTCCLLMFLSKHLICCWCSLVGGRHTCALVAFSAIPSSVVVVAASFQWTFKWVWR